MQLDTSDRGFSFYKGRPLWMCVSIRTKPNRSEIINLERKRTNKSLVGVRGRTKIKADRRRIVEQRPISTTSQLAALILVFTRKTWKSAPGIKPFGVEDGSQ
jgi:16S rRNA C1402 N4-methylase RsmH